MQSIIRALAAAQRFGRLTNAIATVPAIMREAPLRKLDHAQRLMAQAEKKRQDALSDLADELYKLHGEAGALAIINGVRAENVMIGNEAQAAEEAARRIAFNVQRGTAKTSAMAQEMAGTTLSAGAWVKVIARVDELVQGPPLG